VGQAEPLICEQVPCQVVLTEFTHISFPLEKTGLTLSNQITMHRKSVVASLSVPKFLEARRNFTV